MHPKYHETVYKSKLRGREYARIITILSDSVYMQDLQQKIANVLASF